MDQRQRGRKMTIHNQSKKETIRSIIKTKIVQIVIANGNYCPFSAIQKSQDKALALFDNEEELLGIISEILDKNTSYVNQTVGFSLKPEYYILVDIGLSINEKAKGRYD